MTIDLTQKKNILKPTKIQELWQTNPYGYPFVVFLCRYAATIFKTECSLW